jgi:H/ACA ribonucleoprotein complex subunit 4
MPELPYEQKRRTVMVRKISETSEKYGKYPALRTVEELITLGVVNIDKPAGPTSHQVSAYLQEIFGIGKSGHAGTLDPNVTGVLPIALNKATKIVQTLLTSGKEYVCVMHLHSQVEEYDLYKAFEKFTGTIKQLPPVKSAVKRQLRERDIYYVDVLEIKDQDVLFVVGCQAGTYIRKLVHDIGQELKVGAHMAELRRTKAGSFDESTLCTLQDATDAMHYYKQGNERFIRKVVQPIENAISHLGQIWLLDTTVDTICHGASLAVPGISKLETGIEKGDLVAVLTLKGELVAYGKALMSTKEMMGEKGLAVKIEKVVMEPGVYPRIQRP